MTRSAQKGNLANAALVIEEDRCIASGESLVASSFDATAHDERLLVEMVCKKKASHYTPGLIMVTVVEPCLMCLSACAQAGYKEVAFIIPAHRYIQKIPYMSDVIGLDKNVVAKAFLEPIALTHLKEFEEQFCDVFEKQMMKGS